MPAPVYPRCQWCDFRSRCSRFIPPRSPIGSSTDPPSCDRVVVAVAVVVEAGFGVFEFGAEPPAVGGGEVSEGGAHFAEGVVGVDGTRRHAATGAGGEQAHHVSIAIVADVVGHGGAAAAVFDHQKAADASGALGRSAQIVPPDVPTHEGDRSGGRSGGGLKLAHDVPEVVEETCGLGRRAIAHGLRDASAHAS